MALREIALGTARKPHHKDFNSSTQALSQLYTAYVPAFDTAGITKVFIGVHDTVGAIDLESLAFGPVRRLLNVATVDVPLDLSWYAALPELAKAQMQLEVVRRLPRGQRSAALGAPAFSRGVCPVRARPFSQRMGAPSGPALCFVPGPPLESVLGLPVEPAHVPRRLGGHGQGYRRGAGDDTTGERSP